MTCKGCERAERNPMSGLFVTGCTECAVRQLAQCPEHHEARMRGRMLPAYKARLRAVFGDGWEAGHMRVKAFAFGKEKVEA